MKKKKSYQKPIELDVHLKYVCPQKTCGYTHWLSLKECQTKNFMVVCDCGEIFKPKQINKLKILYKEKKPKEAPTPATKPIEPIEIEEVSKPILSLDKQNQCAKILVGYGFTEKEAKLLIDKGFAKNPIDEVGALLKYILSNLESLK
jgi:hypothetical protein